MLDQLEATGCEELQEMWKGYLRDGDLTHRNELIVAYQPLVTSTVRRLPHFVRTYWETDELRSFGQEGLMRAIRRWSDTNTAGFEPYAHRCIQGAIYDEMRKLDWLPRTLRQRLVAYKTTEDSLFGSLGRSPCFDEVGDVMGLSAQQSDELKRAVMAAQVLQLEGARSPSHSAGFTPDFLPDTTIGPEESVLRSEDMKALRQAIANLDEREYKVLVLAFVQELTQEKIGKIIGVGGWQVSKIQSTAIKKLRIALSAGKNMTVDTSGLTVPRPVFQLAS